MPRQPPDHRARRINALVTEGADAPQDPIESSYYYLLTNDDCPIPTVREAAGWYEDEGFAHLVNALQLGKAPPDLIASGLDLDPAILVPYFYLFFDRTVFRHSLDVLRYVDDLRASDLHRKYYDTAIQQGPEHLINRFRIGARPAVPAERIMETIANDQYDRFLSHRGQEITSEIAKEALKWGQAAVASANVLVSTGKGNKESAFTRLKIALTTCDETETPESMGMKPEDISPG